MYEIAYGKQFTRDDDQLSTVVYYIYFVFVHRKINLKHKPFKFDMKLDVLINPSSFYAITMLV